jgi:toxin FitB
LTRPSPPIEAQSLELLYVTEVTLAEIRFGVELLPDAGRRSELNSWLTHKVRPMFDQRVVPVTEDIMFTWRLLVEAGRKGGHTFSQPDLIIAATAQHHGLTVVSRDTADYVKARVSAFNPWVEATPPKAYWIEHPACTCIRVHIRGPPIAVTLRREVDQAARRSSEAEPCCARQAFAG